MVEEIWNCIELHCRWILVRECHTTCMPIAVVDRYLCYAQFCRHYSWYNIKSQSNIHSFWQHIGVFLPFLLHLPLTFLFFLIYSLKLRCKLNELDGFHWVSIKKIKSFRTSSKRESFFFSLSSFGTFFSLLKNLHIYSASQRYKLV